MNVRLFASNVKPVTRNSSGDTALATPRSVGRMDIVRAELAADPTIDITTIGRRSGQPRRIEIWMLDVDGRFFITGTPGPRDWLANLQADSRLVVHLKHQASVDLDARAAAVTDEATRRHVLEHVSAQWYRDQTSVDDLAADAPMVEVTFARSGPTSDAQRRAGPTS